MKKLLLCTTAIIFAATLNAQWLITTLGETGDTITFDATFSGVNNGSYKGTGLSTTPAAGLLDSDAWAISGMSDGNSIFGGSYTTTSDYARGVSAGGVTSGGVYAFGVSAGDTAMGVQPTGSDWSPGAFVLKVVNTTGGDVDTINISYDLYINNNEARGNFFNLSYGVNDTSALTEVTELNDTSVVTSQGSVTWIAYNKQTLIIESLADDDTLFLVWKGNDVSGSGSRDEFALDNIAVEFFAPGSSTGGGLPWYPISLITTNDSNGLADSLGVNCWTSGVVMGVDLRGGNGISMTLWDGEGINVFSSSDVDSYVVAEGDSLLMRGVVDQFNGLLQFVPDSIVLVNSANSIPAPLVVTSLSESTESELVRINNFWVNSINGASYELSNGTNTVVMRIDSDTDIPANVDFAVGDTICYVIGIGGQFDNSSPYMEGYQFFPQRASDVDNSCGSIIPPPVPFYPISLINNVDANGIADSTGVYCWTKGVVLGIDINGIVGYQFTLWESEGISIYSEVSVNSYEALQGDSLLVRGIISSYRGLVELTVDSIELLNSGNSIPPPVTVTRLNEATESMPIRMINVRVIDPAQWPTSFSSNVQIETCNGDTVVMRIDSDTDVQDSIPNPPTGWFSVTGIGGQFDNNSPYFDAYQIFPMFFTDIDTTTAYDAPSLVINEVMTTNETSATDNNGDHDQWVELRNTGTTAVDMAGLFFTNDAAEPLKYQVPNNSTETLAAGGYALVWCDNQPAQGDLHTNFTLSTSAGYFAVNSYDGCAMVSELAFPALAADESYGYYPEGTDTLVTFPSYSTTPGAMNELIDTVNSIGVVANATSISVYPNPAEAHSVVKFNKEISFTLFDAQGRVINTFVSTSELNVASLAKGSYFIQTKDGKFVQLIVE